MVSALISPAWFANTSNWLADEGRLQLDDLAEGLGAGELLGEVEGGIEIALGKIDELAIEGGGALAGGVERPLERVDRLFELLLAALVGLAASGSPSSRRERARSQARSYRASTSRIPWRLCGSIARLLGGGLR